MQVNWRHSQSVDAVSMLLRLCHISWNGWSIGSGEVYFWGKIVDCQYGYRAQYAYPKRFYSNSYEYKNAYDNSIFVLHEFNVPVEPMPERLTLPAFCI